MSIDSMHRSSICIGFIRFNYRIKSEVFVSFQYSTSWIYDKGLHTSSGGLLFLGIISNKSIPPWKRVFPFFA